MDSNTLWRIINKHFEDNPNYLVSHHLESYNDFFKKGIFDIFKNKNPIQIVSAEKEEGKGVYKHRCNLYLGGKDGRRLYFGKPMIHDGEEDGARGAHYMYPNEARLRNMTYAMTVHYDVEVEFIDIVESGEEPYMVGPEFLPEEEVLRLGGYGGATEEDADYTQAFEEELTNKVSNYKLGGGLQDEPEDQTGGAPKKKSGADENALPKRKEKRPVKLTPALSAALNEAQAQSVAGTTQRRHVLLNKVYLG